MALDDLRPRRELREEDIDAEHAERRALWEEHRKQTAISNYKHNFDSLSDHTADDQKTIESVKRLLPHEAPHAPETSFTLSQLNAFFDQGEVPSGGLLEEATKWIEADPEQRRTRGIAVEQFVTEQLESEKKMNIGGLFLMREIERSMGAILFDPRLTATLCNHIGPESYERSFTLLNRANDPEGNIALHQMLDFFQTYVTSVQNITPNDAEYDEIRYSDSLYGAGNLHEQLEGFLPFQEEAAANYLVLRHIENALHMLDLYASGRDALSGTPGGSQDKTIYTFKHLQESNDLRRRLGIMEGYAIKNPVLPVAPGFAGYFEDDRLVKVFPLRHLRQESDLSREDAAFVAANNPDLDWIYDELNAPLPPDRRHASNGLEKLRAIWGLDRELRNSNDFFYYDLSRIDLTKLHPMVRGDLLHRNFEYIKAHTTNAEQPDGMPLIQLKDKLIVAEGLKPADILLFQFFSSIGMRKRIEDEFGIGIEHLNLGEQMQFMHILNTEPVESFDRLRSFSRNYEIDGFKTFLVTASDESLRTRVFEFGESGAKEEAARVFEAYGRLVSSIDSVGDYLRDQFGHTGGQATQEVIERMLTRARGLLAHAYQHKDNPEQLATLIESAQAENALFLETFRTLRAEGALKLEDAKEIELTVSDAQHAPLSEVDRLKMESIIRKNYADAPEAFREIVVQSTLKAFNREGTDWHVLRYRNVPVAYNRFDDMEKMADGRERKYFGSFNVDPSFGNGRMGDVMIEQTVLREAKETVLEADCNPKTSVSGRYIEVGFIANDFYDMEGVPSLHITMDSKINEQSVAKTLSEDELAVKAEAGAEENGVLYRTSDGSSNLELIKQGYALTRYLRQGDHFCCAFEKLNVPV